MKKQFFRVKQLADQTFLRVDKSEDLNYAELQNADRKIEYIRSCLTAISKKIPNEGASQNEISEKRLKKYHEYQLYLVLQELAKKSSDSQEHNGRSDDICELFRNALLTCGEIEKILAFEQSAHESKVEEMVSKPIFEVLEKELPNISKLKRNLSKYLLDKDSAQNRYNNANRHGGSQKEAIKLELEEADMKVEQSRDALAAEMFNVLRKENLFSQYILQLLKLQRAYHESALKTLDECIPNLESKIGDSATKPVFGTSLQEHLRVTNRKIALPLEICICALRALGMSEEGIFRMGGGLTRIKRLKLSIDSGSFTCPLLPEYRDVHVIASTLKMYLRELPEPILTSICYNDWIESMKIPEEQRLQYVKQILNKLPEANRDNLSYLMQFLAELTEHPETKMNSSNIAIVIAPNLLWQDQEIDRNMSNCASLNMIVEFFINNVAELFPKDFSLDLKINVNDLFNRKKNNSSENDSPKTAHRKKKPVAPVPPKNDAEFAVDHINLTAPYPSGSSTLNRPYKVKSTDHPQSQTMEFNVTSKQNMDDYNHSKHMHVSSELPTMPLLNFDDSKTADYKNVKSQSSANIQLSTARPVQQVTAQVTTTEFSLLSNNHKPTSGSQTTVSVSNIAKPIAAPRSAVTGNDKDTNISTNLNVDSGISKSMNCVDGDDEVEYRRQKLDDNGEKPTKPAIPIRPASLRTIPKADNAFDSSLQKTQCSVYNVAHKQQPSIVNIQNREKFQAGHDSQIAEKEKFLNHQPERVPAPRTSLENKFSDINSNCDSLRSRTSSNSSTNKPEIPSKPPIMKSNEMLTSELPEKCNGNTKPTSHIRTRSDGHIVDVNSATPIPNFLTTPPSPKSLNKPTQPPPPPPVITSKPKSDDSTDL